MSAAKRRFFFLVVGLDGALVVFVFGVLASPIFGVLLLLLLESFSTRLPGLELQNKPANIRK
jgi:hypothetical protein